MDFDKKIIIETDKENWVSTKLPGVERRMLERENAETGHATSIVRFAPDSEFSPHTHEGGEEFFVLDGVFSDESGDYGAGYYVRNPIGSKHRPYSKQGATIFVKLCQMDMNDQEFVRIDTQKQEWLPGLVEGLDVMPLHQYGSENIALVRWQPGTKFQQHIHPAGEEILVIEGVFEDEYGRYPKGTWLRSPPNSTHKPFSTEGTTILVKTGHLVEMAIAPQRSSTYSRI